MILNLIEPVNTLAIFYIGVNHPVFWKPALLAIGKTDYMIVFPSDEIPDGSQPAQLARTFEPKSWVSKEGERGEDS